ncbi:hypothetical protein [Iamia sp.]|uniref:hypothetical protein n=1 Tax=Iamia sp. TaxID=2722710 RepID=UPI002CA96EB5|nr:hypothetical protein [Iamia sp.]HXH59089.1 hypothetical protein [Iamia sp.]
MSSDHFTVRAVVLFLGATALAGLGGLVYLIRVGVSGADLAIVAGPAGTALGALATLLARTSTSGGTSPVEVVNPPADPVNVAEAGNADTVILVFAVIVIAISIGALFAFDVVPN